MLANSTTKGTVLVSRLGKFLGATTRSMSNYLNRKVEDNVEEQQFELPLDNDDVAFIQYELTDQTYDLVETVVPKEYSGQGLGKLLAQKTFDHIISQNGKMKLTCDFLVHFYSQNKDQYKEHIV